MIKKSLLILISLFIFVSCSAIITSPVKEKELIEKYGIDINQSDAAISQQIEKNLKGYFAEMGSYRVILTGIPKDYTQTTVNESLYDLILEAAAKVSTTMNIDVDLRNIDFQDLSIRTYMFSSAVTKYKNINISFVFPENKIRTIANNAFSGIHNTKEITIPDSVIAIKEHAFTFAASIEELTLGNGLQEIGPYAFMNVEKLKEVIIPDSVKTIGNGAFNGPKIETLKLSSSLESIGDDAFGYCYIKELRIPASVKSIGHLAFAYCMELTIVHYYGITPDDVKDGGKVFFHCTKLDSLMLHNAKFINDPAWETFLGANFVHIYY